MIQPTPTTEFLNIHAGDCGLVLGNGISRKVIDLDRAQDDAWLFGCNAIVRDHPVDYVCGMDYGVCTEWGELGVEGPVYVCNKPPHEMPCTRVGETPVHSWSPLGDFEHHGMTAGVYAVCLAIVTGCDPIYLAGFDQDGDNVYRGTRNYAVKLIADRGGQGARIDNCIQTLVERLDIAVPRMIQFPPYSMSNRVSPWSSIHVTRGKVPANWIASTNEER